MSLLFAEIFQIERPTDDIVQQMIEQKLGIEFGEDYGNDIEKASAESSPSNKVQTFKQQVKNTILNQVKLQKPIDIHDSNYKDLIITFIHSACNLRSQNFKLASIRRHRVEELVYNIRPNLNVTGSIAGSLAILDLLKFVSVSYI